MKPQPSIVMGTGSKCIPTCILKIKSQIPDVISSYNCVGLTPMIFWGDDLNFSNILIFKKVILFFNVVPLYALDPPFNGRPQAECSAVELPSVCKAWFGIRY